MKSKNRVTTKTVIHELLVDPAKVLMFPLHIKLSFMKQFVKALNKEGDFASNTSAQNFLTSVTRKLRKSFLLGLKLGC